jgi:hypothetical protein
MMLRKTGGPMKKVFLSFALLVLASCSREYLLEEPGQEAKNEKPLWWVLQKKETGARRLAYEDKWYSYEAKFEYISPGEDIMKNVIYGQCPIESADYKVTDKENNEVVRQETINQMPCGQCHKR